MNVQHIAVLGGGPAASALAIMLARQGKKVSMFYLPPKAPMLVGESLTPAVIPMLQKLGVEEEVKAYSKYKPGACFTFATGDVMQFAFNATPNDLPDYAYNVPRLKFDQTLRDKARSEGVNMIEAKAELTVLKDEDRVELTAETLEQAGFSPDEQPDLIVDATGRVRLISNLLDIPSRKGAREDAALFAHVDKLPVHMDGAVHTDQLDAGWCWRIPLPDCVSLGLVVPAKHADQFGETPEEQYDNLLKQDGTLQRIASESKRISPVFRFSNYQLVSERALGSNWVLLGDSAGFIDPVFSSGLLIALDSAFRLADAIGTGRRSALEKYEKFVLMHLKAWHKIIAYFYNGRLFTSFKIGDKYRDSGIGRLFVPHVSRHMSRIFAGSAAMNRYSRNLLRVLSDYGLRDNDPQPLSIK